MAAFDQLMMGFAGVLGWKPLFYCFIGCLWGTVVGVLPGLTEDDRSERRVTAMDDSPAVLQNEPAKKRDEFEYAPIHRRLGPVLSIRHGAGQPDLVLFQRDIQPC